MKRQMLYAAAVSAVLILSTGCSDKQESPSGTSVGSESEVTSITADATTDQPESEPEGSTTHATTTTAPPKVTGTSPSVFEPEDVSEEPIETPVETTPASTKPETFPASTTAAPAEPEPEETSRKPETTSVPKETTTKPETTAVPEETTTAPVTTTTEPVESEPEESTAESRAAVMAQAAYAAADWNGLMEITDAETAKMFLDIDLSLCMDHYLATPMISINLNEILIVKPISGAEDTIKSVFDTHFEYIKTSAAFYPSQEIEAEGAVYGVTDDGYYYIIVHEKGAEIAEAMLGV